MKIHNDNDPQDEADRLFVRKPLISAGVWVSFTLWLYAVLGFIALLMLVEGCRGASVVTEEFLDRIAQRESGNNPLAIGRHGERGAYQLRPCAVREVNNTLGWRMTHREASVRHGRAYARAYCLRVESLIRIALRRQPTQPEVYDAYRLGPTGFLRIQGAGQFRKGKR